MSRKCLPRELLLELVEFIPLEKQFLMLQKSPNFLAGKYLGECVQKYRTQLKAIGIQPTNRWSQLIENGIDTLSSNCLVVRSNPFKEISIYARQCFETSLKNGICYFEINIKTIVKSHPYSVAIIFGLRDPECRRKEHGFMYSSNGWLHQPDRLAEWRFPGFETGDTVGCGLNRAMGQLFFTKNGKRLAEGNVKMNNTNFRNRRLFPHILMTTGKSIVLTNFGQLPFLYNIAKEKGIINSSKC